MVRVSWGGAVVARPEERNPGLPRIRLENDAPPPVALPSCNSPAEASKSLSATSRIVSSSGDSCSLGTTTGDNVGFSSNSMLGKTRGGARIEGLLNVVEM